MPDTFVDYQRIKKEIPIESIVPWLELPLARTGDQLRGPCPACRQGGPRALVITPAKGAYYCFSQKRGGDVIALAAHIRGTGQKEAALWLMERRGNSTARTVSTEGTSPRKRRKRADKPLSQPVAPGRPQLIQTQQERPNNVVELRPAPKKKRAQAAPKEEYSLVDWLDQFD